MIYYFTEKTKTYYLRPTVILAVGIVRIPITFRNSILYLRARISVGILRFKNET